MNRFTFDILGVEFDFTLSFFILWMFAAILSNIPWIVILCLLFEGANMIDTWPYWLVISICASCIVLPFGALFMEDTHD